jgi:hypothetical protein
VTGLSLSSGSIAGGSFVTIIGNNFSNATAVSLGGTPVGFQVFSDNVIDINAPAHAAGVVDITVTTPGGTSALSATDQFTYLVPPAPVVTELSLSSGSTIGGFRVTLIGNNFSNASAVSFGGTPAGFSVVSDNEIDINTPAQAAGVVDITVTTPSGTSAVSAADQFTYVVPPAPEVTGLSLSSGSTIGGFRVTLIGNNFSNASAVSFGGTPAGFQVFSDNEIVVQAPAHAAGVVDITVTTPGGTSAVSAADQLTYVAPPAPVITGLSSPSDSTLGGSYALLSGSGFTGATTVSFGGVVVPAPYLTLNSDSAITARVPAHAAGVVDVTVTTPAGTSAPSVADQFTFVAPPVPTVTGLGLPSGLIQGGETVTLVGSGFTGATTVSFGGTAASSFTVSSDSVITAVAPAHAAGVVDVIVTTAAGSSATSPSDQFTYVESPPPPDLPTVTGLGPASGSASGGETVTLVGSNFTGATSVSFGGTQAVSFKVLSDGAISAVVPAHPVPMIYPVATHTVYRNADGTGAETTSYSYTWFPDSTQMQSETMTKPVIAADQNGPGVADTQTTVYDIEGRPIWQQDGDGFLNYTAYDQTTGAVIKSIVDVDTTQTSEFQNLPAGWATPAGGGLNLVTRYEVDAFGRTTAMTDPNGNVT